MALVGDEEVAPAEAEVDAALNRKLPVLLLEVQQLPVVQREQKGGDIAILHVLLLFVFWEHYAGVPAELSTLVRSHEQHDRPSQIERVQIFGEKLVARCSKLEFEVALERQHLLDLHLGLLLTGAYGLHCLDQLQAVEGQLLLIDQLVDAALLLRDGHAGDPILSLGKVLLEFEQQRHVVSLLFVQFLHLKESRRAVLVELAEEGKLQLLHQLLHVVDDAILVPNQRCRQILPCLDVPLDCAERLLEI